MKEQIKIFIVEDEPLIVNTLKIDLEELGYWCVGSSDNAEEALQKIGLVNPDIIFMDINIMGDTSGIELAERLVEQKSSASIIFLTSLDDELTFESTLESKPFDYLLKPISRVKLMRVLRLCTAQRQEALQHAEHLTFIKAQNKLQRLNKSEIQYIEIKDKTCLIYQESADLPIETRSSLSDLLQQHQLDHLIQIHRSYTVNPMKISSYDMTMNKINIKNQSLPVSRSYKAQLIAYLKK